jgi:hypothetical protein
MVNYSLALLVLVVAIAKRSPAVLLRGVFAIVLGAALAGFYFVPAAYETKWVNIAEVLAPGVRPQDNFLFTMIKDVDHNRFNFLVSLVAAADGVELRHRGSDVLRHVVGLGVFTQAAICAASVALAIVPECPVCAAGDDGVAALAGACGGLPGHAGNALVRVASGAGSLVGQRRGYQGNVQQPAVQGWIRGHRRVRSGGR